MNIVDNRKITRREFIKVGSSALLGLAVSPYALNHEEGQGSSGQGSTFQSGIPKLTSSLPPHRVVRVHDINATYWDFVEDYYWNFVRQNAVNSMVDRGIRELTGESNSQEAWNDVMSLYSPGDKVTIKFNINGYGPPDNHAEIDALIEVINSVIAGLVSIGIPQSDIIVYDASRNIPYDRYISRCLFPNVNFLGQESVTFGELGVPNERVEFTHPDIASIHYIADVLILSQHLIDMPIMKSHCTGITGSFKNHFGTINDCGLLHGYIQQFANNCLGDIYNNPHIRDKTRLIVGDGLFGEFRAGNGGGFPEPWSTFGNRSPNSLFFSIDPVALDSVMVDYIDAQKEAEGLWVPPHEHLDYATSLGLGIHEHRDEQGQYHEIDFVDIEMGTSVEHQEELGPVDKFQLFQNYPNPFNPNTVIEYHLNRPARVILAIYNVLGEKVTSLVNKHQSRGLKRIIWDGTNEHGKTVASGIYFCTLKAGEFTQTKKITLLR